MGKAEEFEVLAYSIILIIGMDSSENHVSQSLDFYHIHKHVEKEADDNSNFKDSFNMRVENRFPCSSENRTAIFSLLSRVEMLEKKLENL